MNNIEKYQYTPVFKLDLAGWLMQRNFLLLYCKRNDKKPSQMVYYFPSSMDLDAAIGTYLAQHTH